MQIFTRLKLIALLLIFSVPLLGAGLLYKYHADFQFKTTNHGTLLNPLWQDDNLTLPLKKSWQIMFVPVNCTDATADKVMFMLHQLHRALGQDGERVNLLLATQKNCSLRDTRDFRRLVLNYKQYAQLQKSLGRYSAENKIYLIDTLGDVFMYYPADTDALNILQDLKHVLGVSQIG